MITNRLNQHIEAHNLLIPFQLGFKAGRSTIDAVERLKIITLEKDRKYVIALFIDIKWAYDSVWWPTAIRTLMDYNCSASIKKECYMTT